MLIGSSLALIMTVAALPQSQDQAVRAWIEREWLGPQTAFQQEFVFVEWVDRYHEVPNAADLAQLRKAVNGRPQHPQSAELAQYERRLANGPDAETISFWLGQQGSFRRNMSNASGFVDVVVTPKEAWSVSSEQLTIINPKNGFPPGYNYAPWEGQGRRQLNGFFAGAFSINLPTEGVKLQDFSLEGTSWRCSLVSEDPAITLVARGEWNPTQASGRALSVTVARSDQSPEEVGRRWEFQGWSQSNLGDFENCSRQLEFAPDGRLIQEVELLAIRAITRSEFNDLIKSPTAERRTDSVRGDLTFWAIHRFRDAQQPSVVEVIDLETGDITEVPERDFARNANQRLLQTLGLVIASGVVCVVIGVAFRRRFAS